MIVSGFTFLRNGQMLGYPFEASIRSVLPIVDEFVIALGPCEDETPQILKRMQKEHPKIKIIPTRWNDKMQERGYVYGQQKMIAQFNCIGDWAFYLEADEVLHEADLPKIKEAMQTYLHDPDVEALAFDYLHFYGNIATYLDSPGWYRSEVRIIKNTIRSYAPDGLFWLVLERNKRGRYPKAAHTSATIYHYGWVRTEAQMNLKSSKVSRFWNHTPETIRYEAIDPTILSHFTGTHPAVVSGLFPEATHPFRADPDYRPSRKERRHRLMRRIERWFGLDLSKRHYTLVR